MAAVEQFSDQTSGTVTSGGTTTGSTAWTVTAATAFPAANASGTPPTQFHVVDANPAYQSEIIAVTTSPGGTGAGQSWTVVRGAEGTTAISHLAGFTVVQVVTSGWLGTVNGQYFGYPWQFFPENFGAKGDGKVVADVVTNGTTTITSASAGFTSADAGKYIMVHGANGTTSGPLMTTIASVTNSTTVVLSAAAGASVSNCPAVYGTDDVTAINNCLTAAGNYATANNYFAEVVFGAKIYVLGTGPTQTGNGSSTPTFNAQLTLPYPAVNGTSRKMVIGLTGAGDAGHCQYWESTTPNLTGTCLVSMTTAPSSPSGTFSYQSVIGGPSSGSGSNGAAGFTGGYANLKVVVKGISVWNSIYTNQFAYDFGFVSQCRIQQSSAHIFAPTGVNGGVQPYLNNITASAFTGSIGSGFRTPANGNNDDVVMDDCTAEGYECGFRVFDHFTAGRLAAIYSDVAVFWNGGQGASGTAHGIFIQAISAEAYNGGFLTNGGSCQVDINWDAEGSTPSYDISDGSALYGTFRYGDKVDNRAPIISGGAVNLKVINENLPAGLWSGAPSAPANNTAQQNTAWRDATIYLSATSGITVIKLGSTTTGLVAGNGVTVALRVPSGQSYTVTYAGTLTATWWLD